MRSVLFTIPLDGRLDLGQGGSLPVFGFGLLLGLWVLFGLAALIVAVRQVGWKSIPVGSLVTWGVVALLLLKAPDLLRPADGGSPRIPIYGYGAMLFVGFLTAAGLASRRLKQNGYDPELAWDVALWVFVAGIVGARLFYVVQYHQRFIGPDPATGVRPALPQIVASFFNLPDGGLVFYGGLIAGMVAYVVFCRRRGISPLALGDILITSVFVGMAFGRLGCFLNGCCFGDVCDLPWGVTFPPNSNPYLVAAQRGFLEADAARSLPLHPTQIYSSLNALVLVGLTWAYYPFRQREGAVIALGWMAYPISRFTVEYLRGDELGQFGTSLTISQWVSLGLIVSGLLFAWMISRQPVRRIPAGS